MRESVGQTNLHESPNEARTCLGGVKTADRGKATKTEGKARSTVLLQFFIASHYQFIITEYYILLSV